MEQETGKSTDPGKKRFKTNRFITPMMRLGQFSKKMDRHTYVKVAYHGFKLLSKDKKVATYGNTLVRDAFDEPDYALIDTLFLIVEAYLFAQLVDFKDNNPGKISEENE